MPLCPHHADATTPPLGWTMNDLRSQNRSLAPVSEIGPQTGEIVTTNGNGKGKSSGANPLFESSRPADRTRKKERAAQPAAEKAKREEPEVESRPGKRAPAAEELSFPVSRHLDSMSVSAREGDDEADGEAVEDAAIVGSENDTSAKVEARRRRRQRAAASDGPESRPSKRRAGPEDDELDEEDEESFSWTFKFDDTEEQPEELQAKSPLLSRAFRSSVG
ncbi:MAG: hypothetical protein AAF962_01245 [Actinomycetota bacterium]